MNGELILVAVDFSEVSQRVYEVAADMAAHLGARVRVVNVSEPAVDYVGVAPPQAYAMSEESVRKIADARLSAAREYFESQRVVVEVVHRWGQPVGTILEELERSGAGMVVLGSHGHGALYNLLVGSVAEGVLRHARVPVLVVPAPSRVAGAGGEAGAGAPACAAEKT
jgi:nucleotide-binding universal stress UspA family protein